MKRFFSLICVIVFAVAVSAKITWNAKGGLGVATNYGSHASGSSPNFVWKLGGGFEYPLTRNISLMPSLEYAMKGANYSAYFGYNIESKLVSKLTIHYLQVPVLCAYRINISDAWNITLKAGPYIAVNLFDRISSSIIEEGYSDSASTNNYTKRFDAGLDIGVDFEYHRFVFGVETELGFCNLAGSMKNLAFYGTVGWKF